MVSDIDQFGRDTSKSNTSNLNEDKSNNMFINLHYGIRGVVEPQEVEVILQRVR